MASTPDESTTDIHHNAIHNTTSTTNTKESAAPVVVSPPPPTTTTTTSTTTAPKKQQREVYLLRRYATVANREKVPKVNYVSFVCGLTAGVIQAGLFNPMDRALYLSIKNEVPFLTWANFQHPYQGFLQSLGHRAISGGLYFPLEHFFMNLLSGTQQFHLVDNNTRTRNNRDRSCSSNTSNSNNSQRLRKDHPASSFHHFVAGMAAGTVNALITNPIAAVKYKTWSREVKRGIGTEILHMLHQGGIRPFFNGLIPTVLRDVVFGGCYTFLRLEIHYRLELKDDEYQWMANMVAAAVGTIVSGPFNLARNVQYGTHSHVIADPVTRVLRNFVNEARQRPTIWEQCRYIQNRLRLGWGTARVAMGVAFGHAMYDQLHGMYEEYSKIW
jgi:Mitochondrial carrier protein